MSKNFLLCAAGIVLGFAVGFFVTNSLTRPGVRDAGAPRASQGAAGPLDDEQAAAELPPGHPDIGAGGDAAAGGTTAASTSPEAQAAMDKADRAPKDFDAQFAAAQVFYKLRDFDKSALYLDRALGLRPKDFDALVLMGNAKYDDDDYEAAAAFYERALAVRPDSPDVRTDLGNTYFNRKDFDRALAEYRKSVAVAPAHANSWRNIAAAAINLRDKAAAAEAVERLAALDPQNPDLDHYRRRVAELP
jgi:tetratricopeptide (TPR) repeat protein